MLAFPWKRVAISAAFVAAFQGCTSAPEIKEARCTSPLEDVVSYTYDVSHLKIAHKASLGGTKTPVVIYPGGGLNSSATKPISDFFDECFNHVYRF